MGVPIMPYRTLAPGTLYFLSSVWDISSLNICKILSSRHSNLYSQVTPTREAWLPKQSNTPSPMVASCVFQEEIAPGSTIHTLTTTNLHIQTFHCNKSRGGCVLPNLHEETESSNSPAPSCLATSSLLLNTRSVLSRYPSLSSVRWGCLAGFGHSVILSV